MELFTTLHIPNLSGFSLHCCACTLSTHANNCINQLHVSIKACLKRTSFLYKFLKNDVLYLILEYINVQHMNGDKEQNAS